MADYGINRESEHPLANLARLAVECYVVRREILSPPDELAPELAARAGVFVSIKKRGELRGCIGTLEPMQRSVADEIIHNAISSATRDPRFPPVTSDELAWLDYSVDVLAPPEAVDGLDQLDPKRYGVIVAKGIRRGLLLPDLEGVDDAAHQVAIACAKAGIRPGENVTLLRFEVKRYRGAD